MKTLIMYWKLKLHVSIVLINLAVLSCKKFVTVDPPVTRITSDNVYNSNATASAVLTGLYAQMSSINYGFNPSITNITLWTGLSGDEFVLWPGASAQQASYYKNILSTSAGGYEFWNSIYPMIFTCNSALEGLKTSNSLTPAVKQQLIGEAQFMRAFFYFYLINLYGKVPLVLSTDYKFNTSLQRSTTQIVYQSVINDLTDAITNLSERFLNSDVLAITDERVRPTKWAAIALLSRVYLYTGDYTNAEVQASILINKSDLFLLQTLDSVFLKRSAEAIWQLQPVTNGQITNTADAVTFNLSFSPAGLSSIHPVYLSNNLLNAFEPNDSRKSIWIGSYNDGMDTLYYAKKYKVNTTGVVTPVEYNSIFRIAEQYLIRAEARAHLGLTAGAVSDLNIIRNRAKLPTYAGQATQPSVLAAILHENQVEYFVEWGHRWFDLKRTNEVDKVMAVVTPQKSGGLSWNSYQQLYPIPISDIQKNGLLDQNSNY